MSSPLTKLKDLICQNIIDNVHCIDHDQFLVDFDEILKQNAKPDNKYVTANLIKKLFEEIDHFMQQKNPDPYDSQASQASLEEAIRLKIEKKAEKQKLIDDTRTIPIRESDFNDLSRADYHNDQNNSEYGYFYLSVKDASYISGISYCINAILSVDYLKYKGELDSIILEVTNYCKKNIKDEHNIRSATNPPHLLHCLSLVDRENYRKLALKKQLIEINYQQMFLDAIEESNRITALLKQERTNKIKHKENLELFHLRDSFMARVKQSKQINKDLTRFIRLSEYDNGTSIPAPSREKIIRFKKDIMQLIAEKKSMIINAKNALILLNFIGK